jgi:uncharacterized OsmC-like protein
MHTRKISFENHHGQRLAALLEIADRCPVHRTLHSEMKVTTTLADR